MAARIPLNNSMRERERERGREREKEDVVESDRENKQTLGESAPHLASSLTRYAPSVAIQWLSSALADGILTIGSSGTENSSAEMPNL